MKWLIAPDSFKNCLRSPQVAAQLAAGIRDMKLVFKSQSILSHNSRRARGERI